MIHIKKGMTAVKHLYKTFILVVLMLSLLAINSFAEDSPIKLNIKGIEGSNNVLVQLSVDGLTSVTRVSIKITDGNGDLNFADIFYTNAQGIAEFKYVNTGDSGEYTAIVHVEE